MTRSCLHKPVNAIFWARNPVFKALSGLVALAISISEEQKLLRQNDFQHSCHDPNSIPGIRFANRASLIPNNLCRGLLKNEGRGEFDGKV